MKLYWCYINPIGADLILHIRKNQAGDWHQQKWKFQSKNDILSKDAGRFT